MCTFIIRSYKIKISNKCIIYWKKLFSISNNDTNIFHDMIETSFEKYLLEVEPIIRSSVSRIKRNNPSNVKVIKAANKYDVEDGIMLVKRFVSYFFVLGITRGGSLVARQTTADRRQVEKDDVPRARRLPHLGWLPDFMYLYRCYVATSFRIADIRFRVAS